MADLSTLNITDISAIEDLDRSLADGSTVFYEREVMNYLKL